MPQQLAFDFEPSAALTAKQAELARAAIRKYRDRATARSDDDITGRETNVLKLKRRRFVQEADRAIASVKRERRPMELAPARFHLPRAPQGRPTTADGRQSFHFELTRVTKGVGGTCHTNDGKQANPVGHVGYVGRDEAVASTADTAQSSAAPHEAVAHIGYVERNMALAIDESSRPVILNNIPGDAATFFAQVVKHEREGHPDGICLAKSFDAEALLPLADDDAIPAGLKGAIEAIVADPERYRVRQSGNTVTRTHPFQIEADIEGVAAWLKKKKVGAAIHVREGRGGIVQRRITGELPHELGPAGCERVLATLAAELDKRKLRYYLALHAPTAANHDRNWHFHLLFYDRPCELIGGEWDFTIAAQHKSASRNARETYPHRQPKDKAVGRREWPSHMRKLFADAVNVELAMVKSRRRYDPRTFAEMGIEAEPQIHLGSKAAFLAACGAAPKKELGNAEKGWRWKLRQLLQLHDQQDKDDADRVAALRAMAAEDDKALKEVAELEKQLETGRAAARTSDVLLNILHPMARSNAERTARDMAGHAADFAAKRRAAGKDPAQHPRYLALTQRGRDAELHLQDLEREFAAETSFALDLYVSAQIAREQAQFDMDVLQAGVVRSRASAKILPTPRATARLDEASGVGQSVPAIMPHVPADVPLTPDPAEQRRAPTAQARSAEVDGWLGRIDGHRRRLVRRDGRVEPFKLDELDRMMLATASVEQLNRLDRIRDRQNRLIARIVEAVEAAPGILTIPSGSEDEWALAHRDPAMQDGLRRYSIDPAVQNRLRAAQTKGRAAQAPAQLTASPNVHRVIDKISKRGMPILTKGEQLRISEAEAARLGIAPADLQSPTAQRRLAGIYRTQAKLRASVPSTPVPSAPAVTSTPAAALPKNNLAVPAPTSPPVETVQSKSEPVGITPASSPAKAAEPATVEPPSPPKQPPNTPSVERPRNDKAELVAAWLMACAAAEKDPTCAQERDKAAARLMADAAARSFLNLLNADRLNDLRQQASAHHERHAPAKVVAEAKRADSVAPPVAVEQPAPAARSPEEQRRLHLQRQIPLAQRGSLGR
ncbi:MobA/MobL family protein [Sphingobium chlorophenolicum]|uniref:MobA/MobL protein domain-containing protein n=1 Tax=Sphingobium chlorophenolicum TaxID=46429 RepID=A0A081RGQ5_SPHCR|nr:MobA/MobL family protein [Sphingobium chlorophenolicum]KEQ54378.1 hypothetical protein BV95_01443 [Sphingobium chlorophenolicum]